MLGSGERGVRKLMVMARDCKGQHIQSAQPIPMSVLSLMDLCTLFYFRKSTNRRLET